MNLQNSIVSFIKKTILFLSCLAITAILFVVLILLILYKSFFAQSNLLNSKNISSRVTQDDKAIASKIYLAADTENDLESVQLFVKTVSDDVISKKGYPEDGTETVNVIVLGDISSLGVLSDLENAKMKLDKLPVAYYVVPGDRDLWKTNGLENLTSVFGESYYVKNLNYVMSSSGVVSASGAKQSETQGSIKLLFIDNSDEYDGISDEQFKFIRENIGDADFVFLHNPIFFGDTLIKKLFRKGMGQYSGKVDAQRIELLKIIRDSNVKAVFAGDQHVYSESVDDVRDSLKHYVIGALNGTRSVGGASYAVLTVYEDKSYSVENKVLK